MKRFVALAFVLGLCGLVVPAVADDKADKAAAKEALKELQEFIGGWKGNGGNKERPGPRDPIWTEKISWSWRFKGDDAWLSMTIKDGKLFKSGDLRYLTDKKVYQLTLTDKQDHKLVFDGKMDGENKIKFERVDPDSKATQQLTMNTAVEGDRFIYRLAHKDEGRTIWKGDYVVGCTREGVSLGKVDKKNECVVSGGLGTMAISYKGETYYVCCSGCRDAFNENPEKYVREFKAKKTGKK